MDKFKVECKRICVWEDKNPLKCVKLTINTKLFKTTDTLLEHITEKLNTNKAILSLINLDTKEPVELIDDLEEGGKYVGAENREGTFNENIKYETESERKLKIEKKKEYSLYQQGDSDYKDHDFLNFTKKYLKTIIFVLINGRERQAGKKFVFTREDLEGKWQIILNYIAHFLNIVGGLEGLYTLCGDKVCGSWELQHGSAYVAVKYHEKFKKMDYLEVYNNFFPKKSSYIVDIKAVSGPSSFVVKRGRSILCFNKVRKRKNAHLTKPFHNYFTHRTIVKVQRQI
ncbi:unnamed protein product [Brassicogethes aeneus]|uniref:Doublecortin domain-containing protein n=1 Tax=Brassicogethes aeneus TaxID=1431903 RepID=A0A9P0FIM1_BRAAE|nr:unnamed protein product [Brassicogethes aeneus]